MGENDIGEVFSFGKVSEEKFELEGDNGSVEFECSTDSIQEELAEKLLEDAKND